jgi:hypothetical protein
MVSSCCIAAELGLPLLNAGGGLTPTWGRCRVGKERSSGATGTRLQARSAARKDGIDETPAAYKDIEAAMAAQADLVDLVHTIKQVVCVKG